MVSCAPSLTDDLGADAGPGRDSAAGLVKHRGHHPLPPKRNAGRDSWAHPDRSSIDSPCQRRADVGSEALGLPDREPGRGRPIRPVQAKHAVARLRTLPGIQHLLPSILRGLSGRASIDKLAGFRQHAEPMFT